MPLRRIFEVLLRSPALEDGKYSLTGPLAVLPARPSSPSTLRITIPFLRSPRLPFIKFTTTRRIRGVRLSEERIGNAVGMPTRSRRIRSFLKTFDLNNKSLSDRKGRTRSNYCRTMNTYSRVDSFFLRLSLSLFFFSSLASSLSSFTLLFFQLLRVIILFAFTAQPLSALPLSSSSLRFSVHSGAALFPQFSLGQYVSFTLRGVHTGTEMVPLRLHSACIKRLSL